MAGNGSMVMYHRRVLTLQANGAEADEESAVPGVYRKMRDEIPGTAIPDDFPHRTQVLAAGYAAVEDLQDATEDELRGKGLSSRAARAVIAALAALQET